MISNKFTGLADGSYKVEKPARGRRIHAFNRPDGGIGLNEFAGEGKLATRTTAAVNLNNQMGLGS